MNLANGLIYEFSIVYEFNKLSIPPGFNLQNNKQKAECIKGSFF